MALKYAVANLVTNWNGDKVVLAADEPWHDTDPFVKANPHLFIDAPRHVKGHPEQSTRKQRPVVEAADDNPGGKRQTRRG